MTWWMYALGAFWIYMIGVRSCVVGMVVTDRKAGLPIVTGLMAPFWPVFAVWAIGMKLLKSAAGGRAS